MQPTVTLSDQTPTSPDYTPAELRELLAPDGTLPLRWQVVYQLGGANATIHRSGRAALAALARARARARQTGDRQAIWLDAISGGAV